MIKIRGNFEKFMIILFEIFCGNLKSQTKTILYKEIIFIIIKSDYLNI